MPSVSKETKRLNLELSMRAMDRIEELRRKTDATSTTQVLKDAVLTYEAIVRHLSRGEHFLIADQRGNVTPIDFLIDVAVEESPSPSVRIVRDEGDETNSLRRASA
jgi:hypothetical protein